MWEIQLIWDLEDDVDGNYWHIVVEGHGVTQGEVEKILLDDDAQTVPSRFSEHWATFGWTSTGKYIVVIWEHVQDDPLTIYPITAYPVSTRKRRHGQ